MYIICIQKQNELENQQIKTNTLKDLIHIDFIDEQRSVTKIENNKNNKKQERKTTFGYV